jgi:HK97 family phage major capsid protein
MEVTEQLKALKSEINVMIESTKGELTKGMQDSLNAKLGEFNELLTKTQGQFDNLDVELQKLKSQGMDSTKAWEKSLQGVLIKNLKENEDFNEFKNSKRSFQIKDIRVKAAGNMTFSGSTTGQVVDNEYLPILPELEEQTRVRSILRVAPSAGDGNAVMFPRVTGGEGAAANQTEGSAKAQIDKDIALATYPFQVIAGFARVSQQMLDNLQGLSGYLSYVLPQELYNTEDTQLLTGSGSGVNLYGLATGAQTDEDIPSGFTVTAPNYWDCILASFATIAASKAKANAILMNPADVYLMAAAKGSNGQYVAPIFWVNNVPTLFGVPITMTTAVAAGTFYTADTNKAGMLFQRKAPSIRFFDQDSDNVQKNLITVRVEEELAFAQFHTSAVFTDTFANVITAITPA